ncbi:unnamed protein product [Adineta ricciae]|uniref:Envelope fusion protein n=1 Tax=Adineta ricciae TaxID=249248 RepID=A0A815WP94_ADIRI|nr:unnamed protein product [Adineta ricciae]CAF1612478.1 unnamed protein product [Adineta ricciae]
MVNMVVRNLKALVVLVTISLSKLSKSDDWILAKQDIVHPTSGLILQYKSDYRPANKIVTLSTVIPMVADMCYLIPISALKKIPRCNLTIDTVNFINRDSATTVRKTSKLLRRRKRFLTDIVSIGMSSAALSLSTMNMIQTASLKQEMKSVTETIRVLQKTKYTQDAQILQLTDGQFKLAMELNSTQEAINRTMHLVNQHTDTLREHDDAIRRIGEFSTFINNKLNAFMHNVEGILKGNLNLHFIHHDDIPKVIEYVINATNISFEDNNSSISMIDLVTRLLVRQEIVCIPTIQMRASTFGVIIGELVFTSYFAASNHDEKPFFVYEPIPIPFNHQQKRVRLAQMPAYVAIQPDSRQFVRWSPEEAEPCCFEVMTSCRVNPVIRKDLEDMCIYQVLTSAPLKSCRIESYLEPIFVRKVRNFWAISMNSSTKCHRATPMDSDNYKIMNNNAITLPPTSLLSAKDGAALSCDYFYLPGLPIQSHSRLVLYQKLTVNAV